MVEAVILAGGYSSRADGFKMEFQINGKAVLQHVVDAFQPVCERVIVVGGYQIERIQTLLEDYDDTVQLIYNDQFPKGMFTSVRAGVRNVAADRFFLTPGDCPMVTTQVCQYLLQQTGDYIIPSYNYKGGHPILLPGKAKNGILAEPEDSNLKQYLNRQELTYITVQGPEVLYDLDTRQDYETIKNMMQIKE